MMPRCYPSARQKRKLIRSQMPGLALGEVAERQAADGNANEAKHLYIKCIEQPADKAAPTLRTT